MGRLTHLDHLISPAITGIAACALPAFLSWVGAVPYARQHICRHQFCSGVHGHATAGMMRRWNIVSHGELCCGAAEG